MSKQKRGRLSKEERQYILDNVNKSSPEEIAVHLNRKVETVNRVIEEFKPPQSQENKPQETRSLGLNQFITAGIGGTKGIVQMTESASAMGDLIKNHPRDREGLTTMTKEKSSGGM